MRLLVIVLFVFFIASCGNREAKRKVERLGYLRDQVDQLESMVDSLVKENQRLVKQMGTSAELTYLHAEVIQTRYDVRGKYVMEGLINNRSDQNTPDFYMVIDFYRYNEKLGTRQYAHRRLGPKKNKSFTYAMKVPTGLTDTVIRFIPKL